MYRHDSPSGSPNGGSPLRRFERARDLVAAIGGVGLVAGALLLTSILAGCGGPTRFSPLFSSATDHMEAWRAVPIPRSASATDAAMQLMPGVAGPGRQLDRLFPVYAPRQGATHVTWDSLTPTGETFVAYKDPMNGEYGLFSIRSDVASGTWAYTHNAFWINDQELPEGLKLADRALGGQRFETRLVPTARGWLDWLVVRTDGGRVYAIPIRIAPPGQARPYVDGQQLGVGQLRPPDAVVHELVYDDVRQWLDGMRAR